MKTREITVVGDIAYVPLTQGYTAIIDAADAGLVGQWSWYAITWPNRPTYAARKVNKSDGAQSILRLHKFIFNPMSEIQIDHINGNGLDNRRANLRTATDSENQRNRGAQKNSTSGFKGVSLEKKGGKWRAKINVNKKVHHLGYHDTPEIAYAVYCEAAKKHHGEFANVDAVRF